MMQWAQTSERFWIGAVALAAGIGLAGCASKSAGSLDAALDGTTRDGSAHEGGPYLDGRIIVPETIVVPDLVDRFRCTVGQSAPCVQVNAGYLKGTASCSSEGRWVLDNCYSGNVAVERYGEIDPLTEMVLPFLVNGARFNELDYMKAHPEAKVNRGALVGLVNGKPLPQTGGALLTVTMGIHQPPEGTLPARVFISQQTVATDTGKGVNPFAQIGFPKASLTTASYSVPYQAAVTVYEIDGTTGLECIRAVGSGGLVEVTAAKDTDKLDGGSLTFRIPHVIHLYHPTVTPWGDLTKQYDRICAK